MIYPTRSLTVFSLSFTMPGLGWGVLGAAAASAIAFAVGGVMITLSLWRHPMVSPKGQKIRPDMEILKPCLKVALPNMLQRFATSFGYVAFAAMINSLGTAASATFGVGVRIDDIINKISQGIQYAAMPIISQNIAAGNKQRAKQTVYWAWLYSGILTAFFMVLYIFFGKELFMLFSDDPLVHEQCSVFISAILWMFPAFAIVRGSGGFVQGIGNAKLSMLLALLDGVVLRIGLSYLFGIYLGWKFYGFVLGYGLAPYGFAIPSMIYFFSPVWQKQKTLADAI